MQKQEAKVSPKVAKWFFSVIPKSCPLEIKHTRGENYFNIYELKEHQKNYLLAATTKKGFYFKIPDQGYSFLPCDYVHYKKAKSYVAIVYPTTVYAIEIRALLQIKERTLSQEEAGRICSFKEKLRGL